VGKEKEPVDKSCIRASTGVESFDDGVFMFARGMMYESHGLRITRDGANRIYQIDHGNEIQDSSTLLF